MKRKKTVLPLAACLVYCLIFVWLSNTIQGGEKSYEVEQQIWTPEYRTDIARAIDAYERLLDRLMDITEKAMPATRDEIGAITTKLDTIDERLAVIELRLSRIETALGIAPPEGPAEKPTAKTQGFSEAEKEQFSPAR